MLSIINKFAKEVEEEIKNEIRSVARYYKLNEVEVMRYISGGNAEYIQVEKILEEQIKAEKIVWEGMTRAEVQEKQMELMEKTRLQVQAQIQAQRGIFDSTDKMPVKKNARGRPPKEAKVITVHVGDDLISRLLENARKSKLN